MRKNDKKTNQSILLITFTAPLSSKTSLPISKSIPTDKIANGTSFQVVLCCTFKSTIAADIHSTSKIFAILLPIIFPKAISVLPCKDENILTANSGADVPNATIVNHITKGGIPAFLESEAVPFTNISAPTNKIHKPTSTKITDQIILFLLSLYKYYTPILSTTS